LIVPVDLVHLPRVAGLGIEAAHEELRRLAGIGEPRVGRERFQ
jgi:hypothetical protein